MSDSDKVKGSFHRVITTPGYHILPQYDLSRTRHIINEKRNKKKGFHLNLAPMVDMFSILVIYLIMNFSSEGEIFFISKDLKIPQASAGRPMQSYPLISVVKSQIVFDSIDGGGTVAEVNDQNVPRFRASLRKIRSIEESVGGPSAFKGKVNLQADELTPVEDIKKVMRVLIEEGWTGINFVVAPAKG